VFIKRIGCMLLTVLLLVPVFSAVSLAEEPTAVPQWSGKEEAFGFSEEEGRSARNPIIIDTPEKLAYLAAMVAEGNRYRGTYFALGCDMDLGKKIWEPIGNAEYAFEGFFDGNGHKISGMYICNSDYAGLFGNLEGYAEIKNLQVEGNIFAAGEASKVFAGGIAGISAGKIANCYYKGTISVSALGACFAGGIAGGLGGNVTNCKTYAAVLIGENETETAKAGGIAGYVSGGKVENCRSDGEVSTKAIENSIAGGVVGDNHSGNVVGCATRCLVTAEGSTAMAGGVVGYLQSGKADGCSGSRTVTAKFTSGSGASYAGGIAGVSKAYIANCRNSGEVVGVYISDAGGLVGKMEQSASLFNSYNSGDVLAEEGCAAGIVVLNAGEVANCYNIGNTNQAVTGDGIVYSGPAGYGSVSCCYTIAEAHSSPLTNCGVFEGRKGTILPYFGNEIVIGTQKYAEGSVLVDLLNAWAVENGNAFKGWSIIETENGGYPVFDSNIVITASTGEGGKISPEGKVAVDEGGEVTFKITPEEGCRVKAVIVDGVTVGTMRNYTFSNVVAGHTIEVVFAVKGEETVSMISYAGPGGRISPDGMEEILYGRDITYDIIADEGYEIESIIVDGKEVDAAESYTFSNVVGPHTIEVKFSERQEETVPSEGRRYTVFSSSGEGGKIQFEGDISVSKGESLTLAIIPHKGWRIANVTVDGVDIGAVESYTFEKIDSDHIISAEFAMNAAGGEIAEETKETETEEGKAVWLYPVIAAAALLFAAGMLLQRKKRAAERSGETAEKENK